MTETNTVLKSRNQSVIPIEVEVKPCYVKPKVDLKFDITISKVNYSFEAEFDNFAWLFCRDIDSY